MAFLYVFTFIPGLFVPYQASAVDLSPVAYKTGACWSRTRGGTSTPWTRTDG